MSEYRINIVHLYPDLLNLYGDKGNIECLKKRLLWRDIQVEITECIGEEAEIDFENADIIFLGGGSEREQKIVCSRLVKRKNEFKDYVEKGGTLIALCGGFELLGNIYVTSPSQHIEALGLFDFSVSYPLNDARLIGNVVLECDGVDGCVVGFENHACLIDIGDHKPLGIIKKGWGNFGKSEKDGLVYKNVFASYLHGPLFPKNPKLCDMILEKTLKHKYGDFDKLSVLDDELENKANEFMLKVLL